MDQTREYASAPSTPTPKATKFPSGPFSTILPMPSLNLNIGSSPPIKRNKRRTFDEHSRDSQEAINRANSIELLKSAKKALLQSFVLDQNPQTAIVIDNVNSLISKKSINLQTSLDMINYKMGIVLDQTSHLSSKTSQQQTTPLQNGPKIQKPVVKLNENSIIENQTIRKGATGVSGNNVSTTGTWSQMLGKATENSENWTTIKRKSSNHNSNKVDRFDAIKARRLVISPKNPDAQIDSMKLRDEINALLKNANLNIIVNTVEKSKTGQNIVLTTSPDNNAEELLKNKSSWEHIFESQRIRKDESWFKVIAHGVNISLFDNNMQYLQTEIEKYNSNMQLCDLPRWLARDRQNKVTSSVVLTFNNQNQASNALRGVNIAGRHCDTEIFASVRLNTQCINCQKFGHKHYQCKSPAKCNICAQSHETHNHECTTCKSKIACAHAILKCVNCNKNHQSNDIGCEMFISLNPRKSNDELMLG